MRRKKILVKDIKPETLFSYKRKKFIRCSELVDSMHSGICHRSQKLYWAKHVASGEVCPFLENQYGNV